VPQKKERCGLKSVLKICDPSHPYVSRRAGCSFHCVFRATSSVRNEGVSILVRVGRFWPVFQKKSVRTLALHFKNPPLPMLALAFSLTLSNNHSIMTKDHNKKRDEEKKRKAMEDERRRQQEQREEERRQQEEQGVVRRGRGRPRKIPVVDAPATVAPTSGDALNTGAPDEGDALNTVAPRPSDALNTVAPRYDDAPNMGALGYGDAPNTGAPTLGNAPARAAPSTRVRLTSSLSAPSSPVSRSVWPHERAVPPPGEPSPAP